MHFNSKWITTDDFSDLPVREVFCREKTKQDLTGSAIKNYHVHFRKKVVFENTENVFINISADDYYKLYINGTYVCQGPAPAYPSYYKYNRVDVSRFLKKGENIIAVHVYYQGLINRVWVSGDNRMGLVADVFCADKLLFGTDESWKYSIAHEYSGDLIGYETSFLENIDFCIHEKGWKELCFDDSEYKYAFEKADTDYSFAEEAVPCADVYSINPKRIEKIAPGKYFIDFGTEITGRFYMTAKGHKGQKVNILCGEETDEDNPLLARSDMRCNCNYNETCTLSGETDEFEFFDYKAFRYVNVFTDIDNIEPESFKAVVSHYKFEQKHFLTSPIPMLNNIWDMCVRTIRYSAQESIYDCPTREKGVYLGDFTVAGLAQLYLTDDPEQYKRILFDFAETTKVCKGMMAIASCSMMQELADYSLLYPMQVLKALAKIGAYDEVLALLINESEHSWVNMLREGATTCFEAWGKEQKWNTSLCHPWATAPIVIITEDLDGKFGIEVEKR